VGSAAIAPFLGTIHWLHLEEKEKKGGKNPVDALLVSYNTQSSVEKEKKKKMEKKGGRQTAGQQCHNAI